MDWSPPGSLSLGFPRQEYWSGLSCPPPGDLPDPYLLHLPLSAGRFFTTVPPGKPKGDAVTASGNKQSFSFPSHLPTIIAPKNSNPLSLSSSAQFSSAAQLCPTLCDPMNCSMPGLPVHHQLPEFTQTHVHRVGDAIQPSHPLSSPSPSAPNPSQHQSLFQWVNSSHEEAKVLEFQL